MIPKCGFVFLVVFLSAICGFTAPVPLSAEQQAWVAKGKRFERAGWVYLHIEGGARERGFQHGYLLAKEIEDGLRLTRVGWEHETGMEWSWLVKRAGAMFKIDAENLEELDG